MTGARNCWTRCLSQIAPRIHPAESLRLWEKYIAAAYDEPHRHYHTRAHLDEMLRHLAAFQADAPPAHRLPPTGPQRLTLELAVLFHDAVYDPKRGDNEERSADWFREFWSECGAADGGPTGIAEDVADFIQRTEHHMSVEPQYKSGGDASAAPPALHIFLDLDLAVLGTESARYSEYTAAIRREYSFYSDEDFFRGRLAFLRGFLNHPQWYKTMFFFETLEERAKENVRMEVELLEKRLTELTSSKEKVV